MNKREEYLSSTTFVESLESYKQAEIALFINNPELAIGIHTTFFKIKIKNDYMMSIQSDTPLIPYSCSSRLDLIEIKNQNNLRLQ